MTQLAVSSEYPLAVVQDALAASIASGSFTDTAYYLFSRRTADGNVGHPRAVYASSRAMRAAGDHFDAQLSGRFSTHDAVPAETADYGYEGDSDIDDAEPVEHAYAEAVEVSQGENTERGKLGTQCQPQAVELSKEQTVYTMDAYSNAKSPYEPNQALYDHGEAEEAPVTVACDYGEAVEKPKEVEYDYGTAQKVPEKAAYDDKTAQAAEKPQEVEYKVKQGGKGVKHTLFIPDVAAATWHALVFFTYTGKVYFAPLRSNGLEARRAAQERHRGAHPDLPALCSPKSMYRLADMVGLAPLKTLAERNIQQQLSLTSIATELFSHFSATYPDVLAAQLRYLYGSGHMAQVLHDMQQQLAGVVGGQVPHAETVLSVLLAALSELLLAHPAQENLPVLPGYYGATTELRLTRPRVEPAPAVSVLPPSVLSDRASSAQDTDHGAGGSMLGLQMPEVLSREQLAALGKTARKRYRLRMQIMTELQNQQASAGPSR